MTITLNAAHHIGYFHGQRRERYKAPLPCLQPRGDAALPMLSEQRLLHHLDESYTYKDEANEDEMTKQHSAAVQAYSDKCYVISEPIVLAWIKKCPGS